MGVVKVSGRGKLLGEGGRGEVCVADVKLVGVAGTGYQGLVD